MARVTVAQQRPEGRVWSGVPGVGGPLDLLQRVDVQGELELLDEQKKEMRSQVETFNERRREVVRSFAPRNAGRTVSRTDLRATRNI